MAQAIGSREALPTAAATPRTGSAVATARLIGGGIGLLGLLFFFFGTSWDIQWHTYIGRDRTLIPPHLMMLTGVALSGVAALGTVLLETFWTRRGTDGTPGTLFAGVLYGPLGAYVTGFGALTAAIAFPLDSYWHALYGIDVAIWAPFHLMILGGMGLAAVGVVYQLVSAGHLAARRGATGMARWATGGAILTWASVLAILSLLLGDALDTDTPHVLGAAGTFALNFYPFLSGLLCSWVLVAALSALPGRRTATAVAGATLLMVLIMSVFVLPATDALVVMEHLAYRNPDNPPVPAVGLQWPLTPFIAALLLDPLARRIRRPDGGLPFTRRLWATAAIASIPLPVFLPLGLIAVGLTSGLLGLLPSLLLGVIGAGLGVWLGGRTGDTLRPLES